MGRKNKAGLDNSGDFNEEADKEVNLQFEEAKQTNGCK